MAKEPDCKILLLQIREDPTTLKEELDEFCRFGKLDPKQVTSLNAFENHHFTPEIIEDYDGLFIGGSSDASVLQPTTYPFVKACQKLIRYCYENNIPVLASCFGFQLAVQEFGGEVILDEPNMEMGVCNITLTKAAKDDPVLAHTPQNFMAVSGHKERSLRLPEQAVLLAYSDKCPHHAFKFQGKPFYAFQFHPEVDKADLLARITRYETRYFKTPGALSDLKNSALEETPHSNQIIYHFVRHFLKNMRSTTAKNMPLC